MIGFRLVPDSSRTFVLVSGDYRKWLALFRKLMDEDLFAPMLVAMGYLRLVLDSECPLLKTPFATRYAWIGELMADAEHEERWDAARDSGFLAKGVRDFAAFARSGLCQTSVYKDALDELGREGYLSRYATE